MSRDTEDKLQDLATYGVSFSKGGQRIDPRDVYISTEPEPEQEPLSDEEIADLWWNNYVGTADSVRNFARAIEKTHGIGVDDETV